MSELADAELVRGGDPEKVEGVGEEIGDLGGGLGGVFDDHLVVPYLGVEAVLDDVGGDGGAARVRGGLPAEGEVRLGDPGEGGGPGGAGDAADGGGGHGDGGGRAPAGGVPAGEAEEVLGSGLQGGDGVEVGVAEEDGPEVGARVEGDLQAELANSGRRRGPLDLQRGGGDLAEGGRIRRQRRLHEQLPNVVVTDLRPMPRVERIPPAPQQRVRRVHQRHRRRGPGGGHLALLAHSHVRPVMRVDVERAHRVGASVTGAWLLFRRREEMKRRR